MCFSGHRCSSGGIRTKAVFKIDFRVTHAIVKQKVPSFKAFFFTMTVVKHWNRLPSKVIDDPCLPVFKRLLDNAHGNVL